jgi:alpha-glucosidase
MSLSGLFNIGHDVGGFHGPSPGPELFCRFVEFCALWPRMVMNSWNDDGSVTLPWMHAAVLPQVRAVITLRHRLLPYLYTQMWRASRDHEPAVRPLFWDFPDDAAVRGIEDAFMFGPDLLVAPVIEEGASERRIQLPAHDGGWYDWHDGQNYSGGRTVQVTAPLGRLPLFVRAGAMIPVADIDSVGAQSGRSLLVFGAPAVHSSADLYEDDGDMAAWRTDGLSLSFHLRRGASGLELTARAQGSFRPSFDRLQVRPVGLAEPLSIGIIDGPVTLQW